uniref:Predicted protein n=1 Tax=Hordeum vulgare subsp. vulgare TaxID=112509 RepID=F2DJW6_HORVV|nr:predicted protein [Hordeum vulgare subsp. vulgare]
MLLLSWWLPRVRRGGIPGQWSLLAPGISGAMAGGGWRAWAERHKPCVAMVLVQLFYSLVDMALKTAYGLGMRPIVFVAYRQGIAAAALLLASLAARGLTLRPMAVGPRAFALLFLASLARCAPQVSPLPSLSHQAARSRQRPFAVLMRAGRRCSATGQYFYFMGLHLASPSMARATTNLAPGITFAIAAVIGLEKVDLRSSRSIAKIIGTVVCLAGAMLMAFFKGPKLLGALLLPTTDDWVKGGIYLMGNAFCFSIWYILQVPVCESYLDPLSLATWMCFLATLQCAVMAFFLEANYIEIWKLASIWELPCILYGVSFAPSEIPNARMTW